MDFQTFLDYVTHSNAIRRVRRLQPIGGKGDYISPPTYKSKDKTEDKTIHVFETRRIDDKDIRCVLLDSVQSQANRLEAALTDAINSNNLQLPYLEVDFRNEKGIEDLGVISTLDTPHRIFDAIIRDSQLDEKTFPESDIGIQVNKATIHNARVLFQHSPTTLVFGGWNSTGLSGGSGSRFQRCIVSEIIGINASEDNKKLGSRMDPLEISKHVKITGKNMDWQIDEKGKLSASKINHGNIPPSFDQLGVTVDYALQTTTITFAGLRHLNFPDENGDSVSECNAAAWVVLAALGLVAITEQDKNGYSLRSRCDLAPEDNSDFEIIHNDGKIEKIEITLDESHKLLQDAIINAQTNKLSWETKPIKLLPQNKLVELIKKSREKNIKETE